MLVVLGIKWLARYPVATISSPVALPNVTAPLSVVAPATANVELNEAAPVNVLAPSTVKTPSIVTLSGIPIVIVSVVLEVAIAVVIWFAVPSKFKVSVSNSVAAACVPESAVTGNAVESVTVLSAVIRPLAFTVNVGIAVFVPNYR